VGIRFAALKLQRLQVFDGLACSAGRLNRLNQRKPEVAVTSKQEYIYILLLFLLLIFWKPIIWECTRPIFTKFTGLVEIWVQNCRWSSVYFFCTQSMNDAGWIREITIPHFHSLHWHTTQDWKIAMYMGMLTLAMTSLNGRKFGKRWSSNHEIYDNKLCNFWMNWQKH